MVLGGTCILQPPVSTEDHLYRCTVPSSDEGRRYEAGPSAVPGGEGRGWKSPQELAQQTEVTSMRLLEGCIREAVRLIPESALTLFRLPQEGGVPELPALSQVSAETEDFKETGAYCPSPLHGLGS